MKVIVFLTLFSLQSVSAVHFMLSPTCANDADAIDFINDTLQSCLNATSEELCGDNCYGEICNYFADNDFSTFCLTDIGATCFAEGVTPAAACQKCFNESIASFLPEFQAFCNASNVLNARDFCNDDCAGKLCTIYRNDDFPTDCQADLAQWCIDEGEIAPSACSEDEDSTDSSAEDSSAEETS